MSKVVKVNTEVSKTKPNFYYIIYNKIHSGGNIKDIVKEYGVDKQNLNFYIKRLKEVKVIDRVSKTNVHLGFKTLITISEDELKVLLSSKSKSSKSKSSLGTSQRPKSNLHALQISFPILSGKIQDKDWEIKEKLKNWIPKYTKLPELGGLRLKNNNNKSLTVWASSRDFKNVDDIHKLGYQIQTYIYVYFKNKQNVILDHLNCETKNLDMATEDKHSESMRGKGEKFLLHLNKKAEKIFPKDNIDAKAWIDGTPYNFSAETNDIAWKREYLNMPFNIKHLIYSLPALEEYNQNLKLHIKVQQENLQTQKQIQKLIERLEKLEK